MSAIVEPKQEKASSSPVTISREQKKKLLKEKTKEDEEGRRTDRRSLDGQGSGVVCKSVPLPIRVSSSHQFNTSLLTVDL